jgi:iron complex outermembrane receptor protein
MSLLDKTRLLHTSILGGLMMAATPVYAQDTDGATSPAADEILEIIEDDEFLDGDEDTIVVTGSRLRRNEFTSASPLKVLNIDENISAGLVDVGSIVQRASVAGGTQFDSTFTGFVTDSGPGSSTVSLRGLDAERTLVLLDGRRLAPSGVRGAPTRPDLNLVPLAILERVDLLTEGASALYGADAVAGVVNFVTKTDFDGIEVDLFTSATEAGGGSEFRASVATGVSNERGSIGLAAEFYKRDKITRGQRRFTPCLRDVEENPETGEVIEQCQDGGFGNMFLDAANLFLGPDGSGLGSDFRVYGFDFDRGAGFTLIPSNSEPGGPGDAISSRWPFDPRYNGNLASDSFDLVQGVERYSLFANAEYDLQMLGDAQFYAQTLYARRTQEIFAGANQIFPGVPCSNPFIQADPTLSQSRGCTEGPGQLLGLPYLVDASGPIFVDVETTRGLAGIRGNLEDVIPSGKYQFGGEKFGVNLSDWTYDLWMSYDRNLGVDRQQAINEERFVASVNTARRLADGSVVCDGVATDLFGFISGVDCVPFDLTDPSLYLTNRLPDDVRDYISGFQSTTTEYQQSVFQGVISGDLAYVPAGTIPFVLGAEFRRDELTTLNSFLTTAGAGTGRDEPNTQGTTNYLEVFMETEIPILKGLPLAEELTLSGAARWTEEQFFGALWTYRLQGVYRPTDWITGSVSFGTTYRAPNLREQNLAGQTSFASAFADPCIPSNATRSSDALTPELEAIILENCRLQGADPLTLGLGGATSIPVVTGGTRALTAEESESLYARIIVEQPWFDSFDLSVAVGYYDISIESTVEEPSAGLIISQCLLNQDEPNLSSPFCSLIERETNTADPSRNFISRIDASFFNIGEISTDGIDIDVSFSKDFAIGNDELTFSSELSASNVMSLRRQDFPDNPFRSFDGRPGLPHWNGDLFTQLQFRDFNLNHTVRYVGKTEGRNQDNVRQNDFIDPVTGRNYFPAGFRDVLSAEAQFIHDMSIGYDSDTWSALFGVRNMLDQEPPIVDIDNGLNPQGYFTNANAVIGQGYDAFGRTFFARLSKRF